jgi:hypothetical protein
MNLKPLETSGEWNQAVLDLLKVLISLIVVTSRSIHVIAFLELSFLFKTVWYSLVLHFVYPFIDLLMDSWVAYTPWLLWITLLLTQLYKCLTRSGVSESHGNSSFDLFTGCHAAFYGGCPIWPSHRQCTGFQFLPPCRLLLFFICIFIMPILIGVEWYLAMR